MKYISISPIIMYPCSYDSLIIMIYHLMRKSKIVILFDAWFDETYHLSAIIQISKLLKINSGISQAGRAVPQSIWIK